MNSSTVVRIALLGDYSADVTAHQAIPKALDLINQQEDTATTVEYKWLATRDIDDNIAQQFATYHGLWCVPASPYENMQGVIQVIRYARENHRPFLGTCGGYQHAIIEYARHVLGIRDADNGEVNPSAKAALITPLTCALVEKGESLSIDQGSALHHIYGTTDIEEQYHCSYGFNAAYYPHFENSAMKFTITSSSQEFRALELHGHPFFFGTAFQPERSALKNKRHPLITRFIQAAHDQQLLFA